MKPLRVILSSTAAASMLSFAGLAGSAGATSVEPAAAEAPIPPLAQDINSFLAAEFSFYELPSSYLTVGGEIAVDQRGHFAFVADTLDNTDWQTRHGRVAGTRLAHHFRKLSTARVYTRGPLQQERAIVRSAAYQTVFDYMEDHSHG